MIRIAVIYGRKGIIWDRFLNFKHPKFEFILLEPEDRNLLDKLKNMDGCVLSRGKYLSKEMIVSLPDLKCVSFLGVGYESNIDEEAATQNGIAIMNTPGVNTGAVAELAVGLFLDLSRKITFLNNKGKNGENLRPYVNEVREKVIGIVGMGNIGKRISEILKYGFKNEIVFYNRSPKPEVEKELSARQLDLDSLLRESDAVFLAKPETSKTKKFIGESQFGLMKKTSFLVNPARPSLVDGHALYKALTNKEIAGAAFDSYYQMPLPDQEEDSYKLLGLPDDIFLVTPYVGTMTFNAAEEIFDLTIRNIINFFSKDKTKLKIVNPKYSENSKS